MLILSRLKEVSALFVYICSSEGAVVKIGLTFGLMTLVPVSIV